MPQNRPSKKIKSRVNKLLFLPILAAMVSSAVVKELGSETLVMTTTYPSPAGIYKTIITTDQTMLARNAGWVGIANTTPPTDPAIKLVLGGDLDMGGHSIVNAT